jgi:protein AroM
MKTIGAVTIGQSPRPDVMTAIRPILGPEVRSIECGALDDLDPRNLQPPAGARSDGPILVTRLRDGTEVRVSLAFIAPRVERCLRQLEAEVDLVLLLCTGSFPPMETRRPVIWPERVLAAVVQAVRPARLGVLTPAAEQCEDQRERWARLVPHVVVASASPYGDASALVPAGRALAAAGVDLVVMDCLGYTPAMRAAVRAATGRPVLLASTALATVAAEWLG